MGQAMTDDDFNLSLFIKLMKMTTATVDNEALMAVRRANDMLKRNGHDWEDLLRSKITIVNDPFGSIPTPPAAKAAPSPPPPPPQRRLRDRGEINQWLRILLGHRHQMRSWNQTRFDQIVIDWHHHAPHMTDADHSWLRTEVDPFIPKPRDPAEVQSYFDTCDFAPLSRADTARVTTIQAEWNRRGDNKLNDHDFSFLETLHNLNHVPAKGRGKAKRLF